MTFRELLKQKDIHGAQLARKLGVDRSVVSNWVRGKNFPRPIYLTKIAEILGISLTDLLNALSKTKEQA